MGSAEVLFGPYSKDEVYSMLHDRARKGFKKIPLKGVLEMCAQLASDGHGDARRALDLLRLAGELA